MIPLSPSGALDRAAHLRSDPQAQRAAGPLRSIAFQDGMILHRDGDIYFDAADLPPSDTPLFLGLRNGAAWQAIALPSATPLPPHTEAADLRTMLAQLDDAALELAMAGRGILEWHRTHPFCACCGAPSDMVDGGWRRLCPDCGASHFPRTDPVVIMLVTRGNRVLVGRSPGWPDGMYSLLAGFMEPGEPIDAAVRREVAEETSVRIGTVRLLDSQPWPFPASLMIGCAAEAESEAITLDPVELEDALWLRREEVATIFSGRHPTIRAPRPGAIATKLLSNWLADRV